MNILVVNGGSSSLKYQLYDMEREVVTAKGLCERIGLGGSRLTHTAMESGVKTVYEGAMDDHKAAIAQVFNALVASEGGVLKSHTEIDAVGHRVLHGGDKFTESAIVTDEIEAMVEQLIPLGPLHNPANLAGIRACRDLMPGVPQVAVFDTAFHQTMPEHAYTYAIPYEYYDKYGVKLRRYGFHGSSHRYVSERAAKMLGRESDPNFKVIVCHLGNGSSFSACKGGRSVDTSMGLTPLEGIPMGTRSGSIDPTILQFIMNREGLSMDEMIDVLNKKSGVLGISCVSSDFRDIDGAAKEGNHNAQLALDIFRYVGKKLIGSYAAALEGVDAIAFTGGVGENSGDTRAAMTSGLEFMGVVLDAEKNAERGAERDVSAAESRVRILVIPTDEEFVIAADTVRLTAAGVTPDSQ
ncbi:MAG: acetate kinase [Oscillospiraceae bacterium]|nr:acetate kinase [Oscillospiraceae bacterium]